MLYLTMCRVVYGFGIRLWWSVGLGFGGVVDSTGKLSLGVRFPGLGSKD